MTDGVTSLVAAVAMLHGSTSTHLVPYSSPSLEAQLRSSSSSSSNSDSNDNDKDSIIIDLLRIVIGGDIIIYITLSYSCGDIHITIDPHRYVWSRDLCATATTTRTPIATLPHGATTSQPTSTNGDENKTTNSNKPNSSSNEWQSLPPPLPTHLIYELLDRDDDFDDHNDKLSEIGQCRMTSDDQWDLADVIGTTPLS
jgi:hypothetical protein